MSRPTASGPLGSPPPARTRKASLLRAGVAALASAVLALWLLSDQEESAPEREAPAMSAAPADAAPSVPAAPPTEPEPAVPPASATDDANVPPAVEGPPAAEAGVGEAPAGEAPAAGSAAPSDTAAPPPAAAAVPAAPSAPPAAGQSAAPTVPATEGDRTAGTGEAAPPPGRGYMVQLGVFAAPANAQRLRDELAAQGYPAHMQSRVVMGPFPDRQAAEAAHAKVRSEKRIDGVIVPPRKR